MSCFLTYLTQAPLLLLGADNWVNSARQGAVCCGLFEQLWKMAKAVILKICLED